MMNARALFATVGVCLLFAIPTLASDRPLKNPVRPTPVEHDLLIHGGRTALSKTVVDTIDLMGPEGSGAPYIGDFESGWNGWTSQDCSKDDRSFWNISDYQQTGGNLVAWCGDTAFPSCGPSDPEGGYGDRWNQLLVWRARVADPEAIAEVRVTATLFVDSEPGWDFTHVGFWKAGSNDPESVASFAGRAQTYPVDEAMTYLPGEYIGDTDVMVVFNFQSDGNTSDADCAYASEGGCRVDDITVTVTQAGQADISDFEDFQSGGPLFDDREDVEPPSQQWYITHPVGAGDFAQLWTGLEDIDPCVNNYSQQVAFIDDGVVVPGTGGSQCVTWCYGPGGYIVTTTGGLQGGDIRLDNYVLSPVMAWPVGDYDGLTLNFDVFAHNEDLFEDSESPWIFYVWGVRSADTDNSAGHGYQVLAEQPWRDRNRFYIGHGIYERITQAIADLIVQGRDEFQVRLGVVDLTCGGILPVECDDGYPAPYFDNVAVKIHPAQSPALTVRSWDLAQDGFPEIDALDFDDLGSMHVRFDAAQNIAPVSSQRIDPGDSIVVDIRAIRPGAELRGRPTIEYSMHTNPVFNAFRTYPTTGSFPGTMTRNSSGVVVADKFTFDLPDTGFLYPGDVLHYYFRAVERLDGTEFSSILPADLAGFGEFDGPLIYDPRFVVHALPTIHSGSHGVYWGADILVWDDGGDPEAAALLYRNLIYLGAERGRDFDFYYTNAPIAGQGNGLGGRTDGSSLALYSDLVYTSGRQDRFTLSGDGVESPPGDDIGALQAWLALGEKGLFLSGDNLAADLAANQGTAGADFLGQVMGLDFVDANLRPFISNQSVPLVVATAGNPVFQYQSRWLAVGGCPDLREFDAVEARPEAVRLAEFTDPLGTPGLYSFAAATLNYVADDAVVSMPNDELTLARPLAKAGKDNTVFPALVLGEVFWFFDHFWRPPVPEAQVFAVACYPNPFNPSTRLDYTIKAPGHLSLKIYNLRGELVRTLIDGQVQTGGHVMWDGTDSGGAQVSSGVYFSEARMGGEVLVQKVTLVK